MIDKNYENQGNILMYGHLFCCGVLFVSNVLKTCKGKPWKPIDQLYISAFGFDSKIICLSVLISLLRREKLSVFMQKLWK